MFSQVQENSPGHRAGLEPFFDFIVSINGSRLVSSAFCTFVCSILYLLKMEFFRLYGTGVYLLVTNKVCYQFVKLIVSKRMKMSNIKYYTWHSNNYFRGLKSLETFTLNVKYLNVFMQKKIILKHLLFLKMSNFCRLTNDSKFVSFLVYISNVTRTR